jgi:hypothetical protein
MERRLESEAVTLARMAAQFSFDNRMGSPEIRRSKNPSDSQSR